MEAFRNYQSDIFRLCFAETDPDRPNFNCSFPTLAIHFDSWRNNVDIFSDGSLAVEESCDTPYVGGSTQGIIIDQSTAFVTGYISLSCGQDTYDTGFNVNGCSANFSSTWTKQ